jgi:hypothetical protein
MAGIRSEHPRSPAGADLSTESTLALVGILTMFLVPIICAVFKIFIYSRSTFIQSVVVLNK